LFGSQAGVAVDAHGCGHIAVPHELLPHSDGAGDRILVTLALAVPLPLVTEQICAGEVGCERTVTLMV
jgi:hypothetical protein